MALVLVGSFSRLLQLIAGLLEKLLGVRRVAAHVKFIRLLRRVDLLIRLLR